MNYWINSASYYQNSSVQLGARARPSWLMFCGHNVWIGHTQVRLLMGIGVCSSSS